MQLAFTSNPSTLRDGIQAAVTITTAQAVNALAVPTSAANHRGAISYVLVPNGSTTKTQLITVGSVGAIYAQVTGGLTGCVPFGGDCRRRLGRHRVRHVVLK